MFNGFLLGVWFQFTHPVWGATKNGMSCPISKLVSIHAPRVGCDLRVGYADLLEDVSIHAPRVGCDDTWMLTEQGLYVSIHAPRVGCDISLP